MMKTQIGVVRYLSEEAWRDPGMHIAALHELKEDMLRRIDAYMQESMNELRGQAGRYQFQATFRTVSRAPQEWPEEAQREWSAPNIIAGSIALKADVSWREIV